jgi:hypothetical protein
VKTTWRQIARNDTPSGCQSCRNSAVHILQGKGDLVRAAKRAARRPTERNIAVVNKLKAELERNRQISAEHEQICEELITA